MKEIIICAALKTTTGEIIRGHRHSDCMRTAREMGLDFLRSFDVQGFMTSKNRFVDRKEAYEIFISYATDISDASNNAKELYSEDLY